MTAAHGYTVGFETAQRSFHTPLMAKLLTPADVAHLVLTPFGGLSAACRFDSTRWSNTRLLARTHMLRSASAECPMDTTHAPVSDPASRRSREDLDQAIDMTRDASPREGSGHRRRQSVGAHLQQPHAASGQSRGRPILVTKEPPRSVL